MNRALPPVLWRLRVGFCLLWLALLAPVGLLVWSTESRLEAQRRLRHEVVAERVFDELEREVGALFDQESRRAGYVPSLETDPSTWAPFVVGYFVRAPGGPTLVMAEPRLPAEKRERVTWAVAEWAKTALSPPAEGAAEPASGPPAPPAPPAPPTPPARKLGRRDATSPDVLKQLNRAQEQKQKQKTPARPSQGSDDPFSDYAF